MTASRLPAPTFVHQIVTVIINYQTPDLMERAVGSFRQQYPDGQLLLIDNGSRDQSVSLLHNLQSQFPDKTELLLNRENLHHGPAMDQALRHSNLPFVLFLDSDCVVQQGGFIESMHSLLTEKNEHYIVGKRIFMNRRGFDVSEKAKGFPYIRPICMLVSRELYVALPPFQLHGTPCLANMRAATERGLILVDFPIDEFVYHTGRGTAGRFGYQLGWRGKWNYLLNRMGL